MTGPVVVGLIGLFGVVTGSAGLSGRYLRMESRRLAGNFTAQLLIGLGLLGGAVVSALGEGSPVGAALSVPALVCFGLALWSLFVRPPKWLQPAWQREMDDAERRSRR